MDAACYRRYLQWSTSGSSFTSDPDMIDSVSVLSKLGNSDHNMLQWNVQLSPAPLHCLAILD